MMVVTFEEKSTGEIKRVSGVKFFTPWSECLGQKGYGIHFADGTYGNYSFASWNLVSIKADN